MIQEDFSLRNHRIAQSLEGQTCRNQKIIGRYVAQGIWDDAKGTMNLSQRIMPL